MFIASLLTGAKVWKQPQCPVTDERVKKRWYIRTMAYYSSLKKNEILLCVTTWLNVMGIMVSDRSQSQTDGA